MTVIFSGGYGKVRKLALPGVPAITTGIGINPVINFDDRRSIITSMTINERPNIELSTSLGAQLNIYVFGDLPGEVSISGISFADDCDGERPHGLTYMRQYYHENKASVRSDPITIIMSSGSWEVQGYLLGWRGNVVNPETRVFEWGLVLGTVPALY